MSCSSNCLLLCLILFPLFYRQREREIQSNIESTLETLGIDLDSPSHCGRASQVTPPEPGALHAAVRAAEPHAVAQPARQPRSGAVEGIPHHEPRPQREFMRTGL